MYCNTEFQFKPFVDVLYELKQQQPLGLIFRLSVLILVNNDVHSHILAQANGG